MQVNNVLHSNVLVAAQAENLLQKFLSGELWFNPCKEAVLKLAVREIYEVLRYNLQPFQNLNCQWCRAKFFKLALGDETVVISV
eukprot:CAMPEP_0197674270 /NCGR_PEP_ID=MMETSP1338-20131121/82571_1 /TAXON_ID=43686 ORGANISM="Pelagodinium beii, Strain RCC1491" /NCGR_SAMPLE_ID=MMETSP1338 /ASSEMBLY_ACC=CAM_ASM_000754 /LENGTH=83 /DNA_ID=CAMNT_0043254641 /DNA_START=84 /DNA_END=335 /DNA_ORIENTATION=-